MASKPKSSSRSRALGSTSSPEYLTIRECYPHLVSVVKDSYDTIGDRLFSKGYVSRKTHNFIRMDSKMPTEKARKLLDTILDRIVYCPNVFNDFIEILEKEGPSTGDLVRELREVYKTKGECIVEPSPDQNTKESDCDSKGPPSIDSSSEDSFHSTTDQPESTHRQPGFVCPNCGECTLEQFFSEKGCPKAEQKKLFPFLDMSALEDDAKVDLEQRLIFDTRKMVTKFASFTLFLEQSLEDQEIPLRKIVDCVLSLQAFTEDIGLKLLEKKDEEAIQQAQSVTDIFIILRSYISFFNYEIMEHLVEHHGSPDDHRRLEEYLTAFNTFCQRSVFEVPPNVYSSKSRTDCKVFAVKCTKRVATTLESVQGVRGKMAGILGLTPSSLQLCSVRKGCMELRFLISTAVANRILPVSPAKQLALKEIGVRVLEQDTQLGDDPDDQLRISQGSTQSSVIHSPTSREQQLLPSQEGQPPPSSASSQEGKTTPPSSSSQEGPSSLEGKPPTSSPSSLEGKPPPPTSPSQEGKNPPPLSSSLEGVSPIPSSSLQEENHPQLSLEGKFTQLSLFDRLELDKQQSKQLIKACKRGSLSEVISLLERGASVHSTDEFKRTPLIAACEGGHSTTVQLLIEKGADLNKQDRRGVTPLIAACEGGHSATAQLLVEKGADLDKQDRREMTSLMAACVGGHSATAQLLIEKGADMDKQDYWGRTPLVAACGSHSETAQLLIEKGADLCGVLGKVKALEVAEGKNIPELVTILEKAIELTHSLMDACKRGSTSEVSVLLKQGASVHRRSDQGRTPLIAACVGGHSTTAQLLIEKGANLDKHDNRKMTPLTAACEGGHSATAQLLIEKGADLNKQDRV